MKTLAERFFAARQKASLTQVTAAEKAGDTQQSVHEIEKGKKRSSRHLHGYAKIFGVSPEWLILGAGTPPVWAMEENLIIKNSIPVLEWKEIEEWLKYGALNLNMSPEKRVFLPNIFGSQPRRESVFAVRVNNDSMVSFNSGEISFTEKSILICEKINIGYSGDYLIVKNKKMKEPILRKGVKEGGSIMLKPLNFHYHIQEFSDDWMTLATVICRLDVFVGDIYLD